MLVRRKVGSVSAAASSGSSVARARGVERRGQQQPREEGPRADLRAHESARLAKHVAGLGRDEHAPGAAQAGVAGSERGGCTKSDDPVPRATLAATTLGDRRALSGPSPAAAAFQPGRRGRAAAAAATSASAPARR
jgi:hypothetical protein